MRNIPIQIAIWLTAFICLVWQGAEFAVSQSLEKHYGLASGHYEREEYHQAIVEFRDLIDAFPSTRQAAMSYFYLGESMVQTGDYRSAYPSYEIFLQRLPQDDYAVRARFRIAECAYRLGWDDRAITLLEDFIQNYPDKQLADYAFAYLGEARLERSEPQLALRVFELALKQYPKSINLPKFRFGLARSLHAVGQTDQAMKFYAMLLDDPANPFYGAAKLQLGIMQFKNGRYELSRSDLQDAVEKVAAKEHLVEAQYWLARSEIALDNHAAAYQHLSSAIAMVQREDLKVAMLFNGAIAASKTGQTETALKWLNQLRTTWPETAWSEDSLQMGIELNYEAGKFEQALADIEKFESDFPEHANLPTLLEYRGRIQYDQQKFELATATYDSLLDDFAAKPACEARIDTWLYLKGLAQIGAKQYSDAAETLASVETDDESKEFQGSVFMAEASCAVGMQQPERAIAFFEQYLGTDPSGASADLARSDLAIAHAQAGSWPACKTILSDFGSQHIDQDLYLDTKLIIAEIALKQKRFEFSERCFGELAQASNPRKFVVRGLSGLAWVRLTRGDEKSAVAVFEQLVREHGESKLAAEAAMACGKYFEKQSQNSEAVAMYQHVIQHFAASDFVPLAQLRLSYNLVKSGQEQEIKRAETILDDFCSTQTSMVDEALYQLAWIYQDTNRETESQNLFKQIVNDYPGTVYWPDAVYRVAGQAVAKKEFDVATDLIDRVQKIDLDAELRNRFDFLGGQIAANAKDWSGLEETMKALLANSDDESLRKKARYWLAESLYQRQRYESANTEFCRLTEDSESLSQNRLAWVNLRSAQCLAHLESWTQSLDVALGGKSKFKGFTADYEFDFVIGRCHAAQGRLTEARKSYQTVIQSPRGRTTRTAAMAQWRIGESFFHQEDYERAIEAYYRVDSLYTYEKWRAAALVEAGKCQEHLSNWNHAAKLYEKLVDLFPNSEFRVIAENRLNLANRQAKQIEKTNHK